jgi:acyl-CoA synthetase (AMP-forming)/AMP-acid ligase II
LEESLEHPWDGTWMGKIDYVFAKSYGTTEGPTYSALGQISNASGASGGGQSASITEAWDFPELMQYSSGELPNSHRHTLKAYGTYAITPEWLLSGSLIIQSGAPITCLGSWGTAQIDPDGYVKLTDRRKDVIKSGGEWISSIDLENAAMAHEDVAEAAVIAIPHPKWDERPLLIVTARSGRQPTRDGLIALLAKRFPKWMLPDDVVVLDELPHTGTGKIVKLKLREMFRDYVVAER